MKEFVDVCALLPHRFPFLFITAVLDHQPGRLEAAAGISPGNPLCGGHFPLRPTVPGVLLTEMIAQAGAVLLRLEIPPVQSDEPAPASGVLAAIEQARFLQRVTPGEDLTVQVERSGRVGTLHRISGTVLRRGDRVVTGRVVIAPRHG